MVSDARRSAFGLRRWSALVAYGLVLSGAVQAAPSVADYQRSLGLREQWITLTENVAWPAQWQDDGRFYYRKTVPGGFAFVSADVATLQKQPAFDQARLAQGLSAATGNRMRRCVCRSSSFRFRPRANAAMAPLSSHWTMRPGVAR